MSMEQSFIVSAEYEGSRLDSFLSSMMTDLSRSAIQKHISEIGVSIDGKLVNKKNIAVDEGMQIDICFEVESKEEIIAENISLNIVYEDDNLLVVNKPQGMVVHPATSHISGTLVNALMYHCESLSDINGADRAGIVHRIDKDTSGLLVVAKDNISHENLAKQFKDKTTTRVYEAVVHGGFNFDEGIEGATIDMPIARHPKNRFKRAVVEGGKHAVTHYQLIEQYGQYSHIQLRLETGRTHQIRVHMSHIGHPLVGDELYGIKNEKIKHSGQILHARTLGFTHPRTQQYMEFDSELPVYFVNILNKIQKIF